jgi:hypothetical protein
MIRAMTAFCAVATAFVFAAPGAAAEATVRTKPAAQSRSAPANLSAKSEPKRARHVHETPRSTALPERGHASGSRPTRSDEGATSPHAITMRDRADAHDRAPGKSAASGKLAEPTKTDAAKKKTAKEHAALPDDDDGLVEFDEPSDVGVAGRSKSIVKLEPPRDEHGKKRSKGRVLRPVPKNASWRPYVREPWRRGYVSVSGHGKSWSGFVVDKNGDVLPVGRRELSAALASWRTGREMLIDERLIALIADISDEFGGRPIRIVSGYRETSYAPGSKHKVGQAFDFSVPGVPNEALRDFLRTLPDVGVGYYPNSTHVHLDVREKPCYWVDYSTPGAHPMYAWDRRVARMSPKERMLAAELDALATQHVPLGRPATENVQRRSPAVSTTDEQRPRPAPARAAFAPVELANPSTMLVGSGAGTQHARLPAEPALARDGHPAPATAYDAGAARTTAYDAGAAHSEAAVRSTTHDAGAPRATGYDAGAPALSAVTR